MYRFRRGEMIMNRTVKIAAVLGVAVWMSAVTGQAQQASAQAQAATLTIDAGKAGAKVSPTLYGLMTEEINYSYEGGLYGELVQDRTFLNIRDPSNWIPVPQGTARGTVARDATTGPSTALPASLKITVEQADA
jgi:alpha-N-arabinofuranosidase